MALLQPIEYDISYFDGAKAGVTHNAGYSRYERWYRKDSKKSLGEYFKDYAVRLVETYALTGLKVLEIGCAKGFIVKDMRDLGVDCYGLDVSKYAIDNAEAGMDKYLTVGDARTYLTNYADSEFDVVFSLRTLECFSDLELINLINEINRIAKRQFHVLDEFKEGQGIGQFYTQKTLPEWQNLDFSKGTELIAQENISQIVIK